MAEDTVNILARHVAKTNFDTLPPRVVKLTKLFILDTMGTMIAGSSMPGCKPLVDLLKEWGGKPESSIPVFGGALPAPEAVLANSSMAHALDLDDLHDEAVVHAAQCQVPTGLAMVEATGKTGKDLITSVAIGTDLAARLGVAIGPAMGFVRSATCNCFGSAASAAKMLGLDEEGIKQALACAFSQSAGNVQVVIDGALIKRMQPALMGRAGVLSAYMAKAGIKGAVNAMDGKFGFFEIYRRGPTKRERLTDRLGEFFEVENISVKFFCGGRYIHGPAEASIAIVTEHNLKPEDVAKMTVLLPKMAYDYVGRPFVLGESPQVSAQFSAAYAAASGVVYRDLFIDHVQVDKIMNPVVLDMAQKRTEVVVDESVTDPEATEPVTVVIETTDGRKLSKKIQYFKGHPKNFVPDEEFVTKFRKTVKWAAIPIPEENTERIIEVCNKLETVEDPSILMKLAQPKPYKG